MTCSKEVQVIGDRFWLRGINGPAPSPPQPFESMPIAYERAFGGTARDEHGQIVAQDARNPVGRGVYASARESIDQPLPNLETPGERVASWEDRPMPCAYGPIPGSWQPRLALAGTFDQRWMDERIPLWPHDIDSRFFCAAAPGMVIPGPLVGGEPVVLEGFSPDGPFAFRLPQYRVALKTLFGDRMIRSMMKLDGVLIEPDELAVTLYWRHLVPIGRGPSVFLRSVTRLLEPWEAEPR